MFRKQDTKIHFVGIGGMGMCGIAEVLANMGYRVSGSDMNDTEITRHLASIGCSVRQGHRADHVGEADVVVVSSAIKGYNPEVEAARARQIPIIPRAEMLNELMRMKYGIAVAGAHGKTTSTTMMHTALMAAGFDPTAVIGGRVNSLGLSNARWGKSDYLVAEADESDGSFLTLTPTVAIVTNVDAEHLDHYGTYDNVKKAFTDFCNRVPFFGMSALCMDNEGVQDILPSLTKRFTTFGISSQAVYRARNIRHEGLVTKFVAWRRADELGEVALPMPGAHNVLNALGVLAVIDFLNIPFDTYAKAIGQFEGVARRFTVRGEVGSVTVVDDFGHHPSEVRATLSGAKASFAGRRIVAAFQPHRFTRTRDQWREFAKAFHDADSVVICDIFAAGEKPIDGVSSEALVKLCRDAGHADIHYIPRREDLARWLDERAKAGDLVITLGAGNIQLTCNEVIELLEKRMGPATKKNLVRVAELRHALADADATGDKVLILGGGSNLVVGDAGWPGLVIEVAIGGVEYEDDGNTVLVHAGGGVVWDELVAATVDRELAGLECLSGIPGLVGATPMQNVGAYGQEVADTIVAVDALDRTSGQLVEHAPADCEFAYRTSRFKGSERWIITHVSFRLRRGPASRPITYAELANSLGVAAGGNAPLAVVRERVIELRRRKGMVVDAADPDSRSAGSFFTNPIVDAATLAQLEARVPADTRIPRWPAGDGRTKLSAGWLIERAGFAKGTVRGNVGISTKHALALVNRGGATTEELLALAREIQDGVHSRLGIELVPEPVIL